MSDQDDSITTRLKNELSALREYARDLETIFDSAADEIFVTDGDGITLRVNSACESLYGVPATALIGKNVRDLAEEGIFTPSITPMVLKARDRVTVVQETKTGRHILAVANPVKDNHGNIVRIVTTSRDISEFCDLKQRLSDTEDLMQRYLDEVTALRKESTQIDNLVVKSPRMLKVLETIKRVASFDSTVLFLGESGTGKDTMAKVLHGFSSRKLGPFVKVSCGAIPESLLESELFGYVAGAFTGAQRGGKQGIVSLANHGTLFLNEIDCLPQSLQVKILHVIQERQFMQVGAVTTTSVDVRIVAASNRPLEVLVDEGKFREDLYYRLNVVPVLIPPLRKRPEDIAPLAIHFLDELCKKYRVQKRLSSNALEALGTYRWPGNVRELENVIERCVVTSMGKTINAGDLPTVVRNSWYNPSSASLPPAPQQGIGSKPAGISDQIGFLKQMERSILEDALRVGGSTRKAAELLGISQSSVVRKCKKLGVRADGAWSHLPTH